MMSKLAQIKQKMMAYAKSIKRMGMVSFGMQTMIHGYISLIINLDEEGCLEDKANRQWIYFYIDGAKED